jgi:sulfite dehydrogenase (cytochrome) subunit B
MKKLILILLVGILAIASAPLQQSSAQPTTPMPTTNPIKSIDLPQIALELPDGPGKTTVMGSCILCHSPRYITMQPFFPRKTWEAQVDKMRKVFGAPIADASVPDIVNYLMSVRGKAEPATQPAK